MTSLRHIGDIEIDLDTLEEMRNNELTRLYNRVAQLSGQKTVEKFKDRGTVLKRTRALLEEFAKPGGVEENPEDEVEETPPAPTDKPKRVNATLLSLGTSILEHLADLPRSVSKEDAKDVMILERRILEGIKIVKKNTVSDKVRAHIEALAAARRKP